MELQRGANIAVGAADAVVSISYAAPAGTEADASAYLLGENGKVRGDHDMVFFNQALAGGDAVRFTPQPGAGGRFEVALAKLPADVAKIVFCVTVDQAGASKTLGGFSNAIIEVKDAAGAAIASYRPELQGASEAAMTFGELYKRNNEWKFRAVGQGFNGGLGPLARSFGIDVADEPAAPPPPPPPAAAPPPPPPPAAAPAPPPAPSAPISLSKVSLEKKGQAISLEKKGSSFGEIVINLNWTRGKKSFFGGGTAIDLDLGCLLEMMDGQKGVVQALGRQFGAFYDPPFVQLDGDDRTGDVSQGETMRINGAEWQWIKRVAIFANIYDGVPNWQATDGVVTVTMPDQPPIEVRMTEGRNNQRLCGVVMLENDGGKLKATRIVEYYRDQSELDRAHGWGMRWVAGSKD
ncbi:MAG TPA: TerD family protein [Allosphingosinicella sp.]|nr:TerD family protein [Allosphingosinicella sp.]